MNFVGRPVARLSLVAVHRGLSPSCTAEGDRSMFSATGLLAKRRPFAEKWTSPPLAPGYFRWGLPLEPERT